MSAHVELETLLEYWFGELADADGVETHLFECSECAARLDALHRTAAATVALVRMGAIGGGATHALMNRMSRDRVNLRQYVILPGESVACTVAAGDDYLMGRFVLPPGDVARVDVRVLDDAGSEVMRVDDLVVDARSRHAIMFMPARPTLGEPSMRWVYVLSTPDDDGARELARYAMDHTSSTEA